MKLAQLDMKARIDDDDYEAAIAELTTRFLAIHQAYLFHRRKAVVVSRAGTRRARAARSAACRR